MWAGAGVLRHDPELGWSLRAEPDAVHLPPTVHAVYAGQLDDLPSGARTAARRYAVAGRRFPAAAAQPLALEDAEAALESLAKRALVAGPVGDDLLGPSFAYRHALLRDAGYASLARGERAILHCRLAAWLASLEDDAPGQLAAVIGRHYAAALQNAPVLVSEIAGLTREDVKAAAGDWFERAAAYAVRVAAWESGRTLALRALEHTGEERPLERGTRLQILAEATANAVGVDDAIVLLEDALAAFRDAAEADPGPAAAGLAAAGHALGDLLRAQTWFGRARLLAEELLGEIGPEADAASRARLLLLRAVAILNASDDDETARGDAEQALVLARAAADRSLELDAENVLAQIASEQGVEDDGAWRLIEERARAMGRWSLVAAALRTRGALVLDDDPREALSLFDRYLELAEARGLVEAAGWARHGRAEARFLLGDWDDALAEGLAAVDFGERHGFHRVAVRAWFVLLPIARERGRTDLVHQAHGRFAARHGREPDSPYARIVTTAAHLDFANAGLEPAFVPDVAERLGSFDLAHGSPSWLVALERVVGTWLDDGELDGASAALDRMARSLAQRPSTPLASATESLLRARLHLASSEPDAASSAARRVLDVLGDAAPWWRLGAFRTLAAAGDSTSAREIAALEARLGLPGV
jgi:tetratricopeptide (TPR) repeat protein